VSKGSFSFELSANDSACAPQPALQVRRSVGAPIDRDRTRRRRANREISVGEQGYDPSRVTIHAGVPTRLTFVRANRQDLRHRGGVSEPQHPSRAAVESTGRDRFTPQEAGNIEFVCGINMLRGTLIVQ